MSINLLADTKPAKEYLVNGITKDVTIEECIFDLIDNSIDAYPKNTIELVSDYNNYSIEINFSKDHFSIKDYGKGITREALTNETLRFGTKTQHHSTSIGFYGIGLNRALFKIGKDIKIISETNNERSLIKLDVTTFLKDNNNWSLPILTENTQGNLGTYIEIKKLNEEVNDYFTNAEWIKSFQKEISLRYSEFLNKNLIIKVNNIVIDGQKILTRASSGFQAQKKDFTYRGIKVIIEAGQSSKHFFTYEKSYDKEKNATLKECGWFVYCNNRAVKLFDFTSDTGWKSKPHTEHAGFIGKVFFIGNAGKLPWNTSKTDVDLNNEVYKKALETMQSFSEAWRKHTHKVNKKNFRPTTEENPLIEDLFGGTDQQQEQTQQDQTQQEQTQQDQTQQDQTQQDQTQQEQTQQDQTQQDQTQQDQTQQDQTQQDQTQQDQTQQDQTQQDQTQQEQTQQDQTQQEQTQQDQTQQDQTQQEQTQQDQTQQDQTQQDQNQEEDDTSKDDKDSDAFYEYDPNYTAPSHISEYEYLFGSKKAKVPFFIPEEEIKHRSILSELIKISIGSLPVATLLLMRAFIEMSCTHYSKKFNVDIKSKNPSLAQIVTRCLNKMEEKQHLQLDSRRISTLHALCNERKFEKSFLSIQNLQITVHSDDLIWDKGSLISFWYAILPFLTTCYKGS